MSAFLSWIADRYEEVRKQIEARARELRNYYPGEVHARLPGALAGLQSGFEIWLQFALEVGAIGTAEQAQLERRNANALNELAARQTQYHEASDPALRFVSLLRSALASGHAHVADRSGKKPESPEPWGWRRSPSGRGWAPQGTRIGWIAGSDLFLDPTLSYQVVQQIAGTERLPVSEQTLRHRLRDHGLLASTDVGRQMLQVRRTLEDRPRQVLHFKATHLLE
jgi:hypothetical protein